MRNYLCTGALVALLSSGVAHAQDGPASLLDRFAAGFSAMDPAAIAALFRPDGTFFGSTQPDLMRGPEGVQGYFTRGFASGGWRKMTCEALNAREVSASAATVDALCRVEGARSDGTPRKTELRVSALALRDEAGWRFASLHVSDPPPRR
jgi:ketosteroid isomerase-like protein